MNKTSRFFLFNTVAVVLFSAVFDGLCTLFLLNRGFSFLAISIYFSVSLICTSILELPTGYIADKIGRKKTYALGLFFRAGQCCLIIITKRIELLYLAGIFEAIYSSLTSGSLEAWLKGMEDSETNKNDYTKIFGLSKTLGSFVSIVVLFSVALFVKMDLRMFYILLSFLYICTAFLCLLYMKDNRNPIQNNTFLFDVKNICRIYMSSTQLKFITYILSSAFAFISIYMLYFQPRVIAMGLPEDKLLYMSAIRLTGGVLSGFLYTKYANKIGKKRIILYSFFGVLLSFVAFIISPNLIYISIANLVYGISIGTVMPVFYSWSLEKISGNYTASLLSFMNAISSVVASITTIIAGFVIENTGINTSMYLGAFLAITSIIILIYIYSKKEETTD